LRCIGYYLPDITIKENFIEPVYFSKCEFKGVANFSEAKFFAEANFSQSGIISQETIDSAKEILSKKGNVAAANFMMQAISEPKFAKEANFFGAEFSAKADFSFCAFDERATFDKSTFSAGANFTSTKFKHTAGFWNCEFSAGADFSHAEYSSANFFNVKFSGRTVEFIEAKFKHKAGFQSCEFSAGTDFRRSEFSAGTDFRRSEFSAGTDFSEAKFNGKTNFNYVLFEDGRRILFETEELSKVSFMNTDITRVRFSDRARWSQSQKDKFKIIEEEMLEQFLKYSFNWKNITTNSKYTDRFKDILRKTNVNWKGIYNLQRIVRRFT
jgi:uncharacterized protein YjbI with pentapeptide repeats